MSNHEELLEEGGREAQEPESAEERSRKLGLKPEGGAVAGGGAVAAKAGAIGGLGKLFFWLFAWNGVSTALRIGGWMGIALALALVAGLILYRRSRRHA